MKQLGLTLAFCLALVGSAFAQGGMMPGPGTVHSAGGGGSVSVKEVGTQAFQSNSNSFTKTPINVTAVTNSALVCELVRVHGSNNVIAGVAMTWNGVSMTLRQSQVSSAGTLEGVFLFGLRNPATGTQNLVVSGTNVAADNFVNCVSFENVNQTSDALAFPNPQGATVTASLNISSAAGHIAVGVFLSHSSLGTIIPTIVLSDSVSGSITNAGGDYVVSSGASTTVGTSTAMSGIAGMDVSN
jgi:hypothetical protein